MNKTNARVRRQVAGYLSQKQGANFQAEINFWAERIDGLILIEQFPAFRHPSKYERERYHIPGGWVQTTGKGWADYVGMWHGRALTFDAKSTRNTTRFQVPKAKEHQFEKLRFASASGTLAFYLIGWLELAQASVHYVTPEMRLPCAFHPTPESAAYIVDTTPQNGSNWFREIIKLVIDDW